MKSCGYSHPIQRYSRNPYARMSSVIRCPNMEVCTFARSQCLLRGSSHWVVATTGHQSVVIINGVGEQNQFSGIPCGFVLHMVEVPQI